MIVGYPRGSRSDPILYRGNPFKIVHLVPVGGSREGPAPDANFFSWGWYLKLPHFGQVLQGVGTIPVFGGVLCTHHAPFGHHVDVPRVVVFYLVGTCSSEGGGGTF